MNIYEKICAIMDTITYLTKDGNVDFGKTKYRVISEEKVTSTVRQELIRHRLVIVPVHQEYRRTGTLTSVDVTYHIVNSENPEEYVVVMSSGEGADTQDKGVGKAMTYAYKYMLLRTFAIPTGEDPDKISSAELDDKKEKSEAAQQVNTLSDFKKFLVNNGIDERKVSEKYKKMSIEELTDGQKKAVLDKKNLGYFQQECGI